MGADVFNMVSKESIIYQRDFGDRGGMCLFSLTYCFICYHENTVAFMTTGLCSY